MWYIVWVLVFVLVALKVYNFLDGRHLILDLWDEFQLHRLSLEYCDELCQTNPLKSEIIVCLTTIPSRLPYIETTLKSLLTQSMRPKRIRLHLPTYSKRENCEYELPEWLTSLKNLDIVRCDDFGPATKIIPALEQLDPVQKLLILDDDMIYPKGMINHFDGIDDAEGTVVANSGWVVPTDLICHFVTLWKNIRQIPPTPFKSTRIRNRKPIDVVQGYSGYLVQPSFFNLNQMKDYSVAPEAAFYVDDVWVSAHCHVPKYVYPYKRFCFHPKLLKREFVQSSLAMFNRGNEDPEKRNNTIMIRFFKDRWLGEFE